VKIIRDCAAAARDSVLLVMLPGALHTPEDLVREGFVEALRQRHAEREVALLDAHVGYYLDRNLVEHVESRVVAPARREGCRRIWMLGISLGGLGALLCARAIADVERVILLAPYLGVPGLMAEVAAAGGLAQWNSGADSTGDDERCVLAWLKARDGQDSPRIYLGYGRHDRFAAASRLLEGGIAPADVIVSDGGHDWPTWRTLWAALLDRGAAAA
jgi:hypothetical protein